MVRYHRPTNCRRIDMTYNLFIWGFGTIWYILFFHPKRQRIIRRHLMSGIVCTGIITNLMVTVPISCCVEGRRRYRFRFAYKQSVTNDSNNNDDENDDENENDNENSTTTMIYIKDFVNVEHATPPESRSVAVNILPNLPESGILQHFIEEADRPQKCLYFLGFVSMILNYISMYNGSHDCPDLDYDYSPTYDDDGLCPFSYGWMITSILFFSFLGLLAAYLIDRDEATRVPGRVWKKINVGEYSQQQQQQEGQDEAQHSSMSEAEQRRLTAALLGSANVETTFRNDEGDVDDLPEATVIGLLYEGGEGLTTTTATANHHHDHHHNDNRTSHHDTVVHTEDVVASPLEIGYENPVQGSGNATTSSSSLDNDEHIPIAEVVQVV